MTERQTTHGPGPATKGGGFRGGPKRWTGAGPAPARHIPWPEIFKHHISVVEGHLKMIDMVRKHTVEGSGNFRTIMGCVDRAKEMLHVSKQIARTFVAPPHQREQVPLGSSSASMYPGYSPADHEYGKAAEDYGKAAAEARAKGIDIKHPDAEYVVGQGKGVKRKSLAEIREAQAAKSKSGGSGSGTGSGSEGPTKQELEEPSTTNGQASTEKIQEATPEGDNPYFVIDTKPTPVNIPGMSVQPIKRSASPPEGAEAMVHKKAKKKHESEMPKAEDIQEVKTEDISERVEARMKEKGEQRKMKEKKKRKRESEDKPAAAVADSQSTAEASAIAGAEAESPKKKKVKAKKAEEEPLPDRTASTKRPSEEDGEAEDGEGKKKKKRKKSKEVATASDG